MSNISFQNYKFTPTFCSVHYICALLSRHFIIIFTSVFRKMRAQTYQQAQTMAIESAIPLHPNYPFLTTSFDSDGYESCDNNHFNFTISRESLLDPDDIVMGDMIGEGGNSVVYTGLYVSLSLTKICILF